MKKREDYLVFGSPLIGQEEIDEVVDSMKSCWLGTGPKVIRFEELFKHYKDMPHAVAVNSCTAALHLSLLVSGINPGDEVITTPLTFCATINAIIHAGGTPVLADVDPSTMNIDPNEVEKKISSKTKAIIPVHFAGRPCDMDRLCEISRINNLIMVEDCAHAIETQYRNENVGSFGEFGCFSFYATKNIVTGEGGMILTKSSEYAERLKILALHGMSSDAWGRFSDEGYKHYMVVEAGFKYNMMDLQAAIGIRQMDRVNENWNRRQEVWNMYNSAFEGLAIGLPLEPEENTKHGLHLYTILVDKKKVGVSRNEFLSRMNGCNIGTGVHYLSIPEYPFYQQRFGWEPEKYPNAARIGRETVSLPLSAKLSDEDVDDVVHAVKKIIG